MDSSEVIPIVDVRYSEFKEHSEMLYFVFLFLCCIISAITTIRYRMQKYWTGSLRKRLHTQDLYVNTGAVAVFDKVIGNVTVENNIKMKDVSVCIPRYIKVCRLYANNGTVIEGSCIEGDLLITTNAE